MKHQKFFKKLTLNKQTIADLEISDLSKLMAGECSTGEITGGTTCNPCPCNTFTDCATEACVCATVPVTCDTCKTVTVPFCC